MKKSENIFMVAASFLLGVVIGFLISPVKHGINIGNDSGNDCGNTVNHYDKKKEEGQQ